MTVFISFLVSTFLTFKYGPPMFPEVEDESHCFEEYMDQQFGDKDLSNIEIGVLSSSNE